MPRTKTYGAEEARQNLPRILEDAHNGQRAIITRHGRPYAAIVPVEDEKKPRKRSANSILALWGSGKGLWTEQDSITTQRAEWD
ncbi:MAG: type II toxin-antitoxin system Phd/YefM family antitoxin [Planctomycetes bacterium]|nr:type II toxin-antitoxin system Phd/YefM family antitoxin [Planctomycetota bacterium]